MILERQVVVGTRDARRRSWQSATLVVRRDATGAPVAGIEGAIDVGHLVRLMTLRGGRVELTKLTLPQDNPVVGERVDRLELPADTALVTVVRGNKVRLPKPDDVLEAGDELLFTANRTSENSLLAAIHGGEFLREVISQEP